MTGQTLPIRWAAKVSRAKIRQVYHKDALGLVDEELIEEVGFALLQRCENIVLSGWWSFEDHGGGLEKAFSLAQMFVSCMDEVG